MALAAQLWFQQEDLVGSVPSCQGRESKQNTEEYRNNRGSFRPIPMPRDQYLRDLDAEG
jgi:hypothetical protein